LTFGDGIFDRDAFLRSVYAITYFGDLVPPMAQERKTPVFHFVAHHPNKVTPISSMLASAAMIPPRTSSALSFPLMKVTIRI
jgi:hypothetical protein